jgi:hypothetical protein
VRGAPKGAKVECFSRVAAQVKPALRRILTRWPPLRAGGRTLTPKNAFSWRVPHPMVLRVRVLAFFEPGTPGTQRREHSGVKPLLHDRRT